MDYFFKSDRLGFRNWRAADLDSFWTVNADEAVMEFFPSTWTQEKTAHFIEINTAHIQENGFGWFATELLSTGELIGFIGLKKFDMNNWFSPGIEIGWRLGKQHWNQGLATEGALACLAYGWNALGFEKVYSFTAKLNKRSARVMQKIGMQHIGNFNHPKVAQGHILEPHVLYAIERPLLINT